MELMEQCSPLLQRVWTYLHDKKGEGLSRRWLCARPPLGIRLKTLILRYMG